MANLEKILASRPDFLEGLHLFDLNQYPLGCFGDSGQLSESQCSRGDESFKFLPHQLSKVRYWLTLTITGDGESGFDSGEGALETATTSKEGSRRVNYSIPTR